VDRDRARRRSPALAGLVVAAVALAVCPGADARAASDAAQAQVPAPASVALSAALSQRLAGDQVEIAGLPLPIVLKADYAAAEFRPIWTNDSGLAPAGAALAARLAAAEQAGMGLPAPLLAAIAARKGSQDTASLADLELLLSGALVLASSDSGDLQPQALLIAARSGDPKAVAAAHLPADFFYWRLRRALPVYRGYAAAGGWPEMPSGPKLQKGMREPRVAALARRLQASGDLAAVGAEPELFDDTLAAALEQFQTRHGLEADGKLGAETLAALNVPADRRVDQILLNLERFRELDFAMGERYLYVNVAAMELSLVEHGQVTFFNRVIVGRKDRPTPLLQSLIRRIDFNPTWVVPAKIARIDLLGHEHQDPRFLREHNIRVYDGWGADAQEIDPDNVDWSQYSANNMPFVFRQDPGTENALGPVKFDFVNDYAVYVHGTPVKSLFALPSRALSSGCIRMQEPVELAVYLLRDDPNWPRARIEDVVRKATTISAPLKDPLPIMLTYQTAWVDSAGLVNFRADIYGLDSALSGQVGTAEAPSSGHAPAAPPPASLGGRKN
jgi:murein L,D-transpeptidase YcbB/YkuD